MSQIASYDLSTFMPRETNSMRQEKHEYPLKLLHDLEFPSFQKPFSMLCVCVQMFISYMCLYANFRSNFLSPSFIRLRRIFSSYVPLGGSLFGGLEILIRVPVVMVFRRSLQCPYFCNFIVTLLKVNFKSNFRVPLFISLFLYIFL